MFTFDFIQWTTIRIHNAMNYNLRNFSQYFVIVSKYLKKKNWWIENEKNEHNQNLLYIKTMQTISNLNKRKIMKFVVFDDKNF